MKLLSGGLLRPPRLKRGSPAKLLPLKNWGSDCHPTLSFEIWLRRRCVMDDHDHLHDPDMEEAEANPEKTTKIQEIIEKVAGGVAPLLFHTSAGETYADILVAGHRETWRIRSATFKKFFRSECWRYVIVPTEEQTRLAINLFEARALFDGPEIEVYLRVAALRDEIWIDLGGPDWKAVKITSEGWQIVTSPKVRFYRERGMEALPEPTRGGTV